MKALSTLFLLHVLTGTHDRLLSLYWQGVEREYHPSHPESKAMDGYSIVGSSRQQGELFFVVALLWSLRVHLSTNIVILLEKSLVHFAGE